MSNYITTTEELTSVADKIRAKTGGTDAITYPAGYVTEIDKLVYTADANATASQILSGKTAYVNGVKITGNISSQAAQTITPGTSNKTIASGLYLSGTQTIAGDADLVAANIKKGVDIFGVTGTFTNTPSGKTALTAAALRSGYAGFINGSQVNGSMADTSVTEGTTTVSGETATRGTWSQTDGYTAARTIAAATFAKSATSGSTYVDISGTTAAPVLVAGDYLYINKGWTDNVKISLARLVPDGSDVKGHSDYLLSGHSAYDNDGTLVSGNITTMAATDISIDAAGVITLPTGKYTGGTAITKTISSGTVSTTFTGDGMSTYFNSGTSSDKNVTITPKYTNTAGYVATHSTATNNGGTAYYKIKTATPAFDGGGLSGTATASSSTATISDATNNSGISFTTACTATRAAVLYNGAVNGWVSKADDAQVLASGSTAMTAKTYYINGVTVAASKTFTVTGAGTTTWTPGSSTTGSLTVSAYNASGTAENSKSIVSAGKWVATSVSASGTYYGRVSVGAGAYNAYVSSHSITTTPVVTGSLSGTGASIGTTTKPSGTDGTDYWTFTPGGSVTTTGVSTANGKAAIETAGYLATGNKVTSDSTVNITPTVSNGTTRYLKKAVAAVDGTNVVTPTASVSGASDIVTLSTTNNGISVTATGGGSANANVTASTGIAGYAPSSAELGGASIATPTTTTTATKYITGIAVPKDVAFSISTTADTALDETSNLTITNNAYRQTVITNKSNGKVQISNASRADVYSNSATAGTLYVTAYNSFGTMDDTKQVVSDGKWKQTNVSAAGTYYGKVVIASASPTFSSPTPTGGSTATGSNVSLSTSTNNGILVQTKYSINAANFTYNAAVSGWVSKSSGDAAGSTTARSSTNGTAYYITSVTVPAQKNFTVTMASNGTQDSGNTVTLYTAAKRKAAVLNRGLGIISLDNGFGYESYWNDNYVMDTATNTNIPAERSKSGCSYAWISAYPGQKFYLSMDKPSDSSVAVWAFYDPAQNRISYSTSSFTVGYLTAPENTAYLIVNAASNTDRILETADSTTNILNIGGDINIVQNSYHNGNVKISAFNGTVYEADKNIVSGGTWVSTTVSSSGTYYGRVQVNGGSASSSLTSSGATINTTNTSGITVTPRYTTTAGYVSAASNVNGTTQYINAVTLPKSKSFSITVYTGASTQTTFKFTTDANGNTTVTEQ